MSSPVRIQRKRTKGYRLPPNTAVVTRPTMWGNPFDAKTFGLDVSLALYRNMIDGVWDPKVVEAISDDLCREAYDRHTQWRRDVRQRWGWSEVSSAMKRLIRGKNLACYCPLGKPCHADILLELANQ